MSEPLDRKTSLTHLRSRSSDSSIGEQETGVKWCLRFMKKQQAIIKFRKRVTWSWSGWTEGVGRWYEGGTVDMLDGWFYSFTFISPRRPIDKLGISNAAKLFIVVEIFLYLSDMILPTLLILLFILLPTNIANTWTQKSARKLEGKHRDKTENKQPQDT